ncbi:MAG: NAD-dependent epimerase/dehydratase family protein [Planctomycetes bacterium]|nr:NAD-dependent epimerase/dehydratase family protein [Planctomycetota bacterium]
MKILVTGAAGFIGSHLSERLAKTGHEVIGLDCFSDYYARSLKDLNAADVKKSGARIFELDLAESDLCESVKGVEVVYHCAAQPGISDATSFEDYKRNNITATHRLLDALKGSSCLKMFVNVSTSSVYGKYATESEETVPEPASFYGVTKLAAERMALTFGAENDMPVCSLRLFSVYGPRERPEKLYPKLIKSILEDTEFPLYEGSKKHLRSFTYVDDIVDGFVAVLENMESCVGEIINIGWDQERSTADGIKAVEDALGKKGKYKLTSPRQGDQLRTFANIDKARRLLGYDPKTKLVDGVKAEVDWYKEKIFGVV